MSVSQPDANFNDVFLQDGGDIKWSAIFFVKIKMHIQTWKLASSVGNQSLTTEVVAEDMVNLLGGASKSHNDIFDSDTK